MVKIPALWKPQPSGTSTTPYVNGTLLIQNAVDSLLLQDGTSFLLLNESQVITKNPAIWNPN